MSEWLIIVGLASGGLCWSIGGTGYKWVRRFVLPALWAFILAISGVVIWKCVIMAAAFMIAFSLPYGEHTPIWGRILTGLSYSIPSLLLGLNIWQILAPLIFLGLYWLSLKKDLRWKIVEFFSGCLIFLTLI